MNEMVEMNFLFIRELNYNSLHATSHLSSMQNTKCTTCHLYIMHLATCQCMQLSTLPLCLTWKMQLVLHAPWTGVLLQKWFYQLQYWAWIII